MIENSKDYVGLKISSYLLVLMPLFLITGPLLPELSLIIIVFFFLLSVFKNKEIIVFKNRFFYFFFSFYIIILISLINSDYIYYSLKPSITYLRFGLFALATAVVFFLQNKNIIYLSKIYILIIFFLLIDSLFQYIFGFNMFGWEIKDLNNFRITSFFGDDEVLGSYVARFFPFILSIFLFSKKIYKWKYENFILLFIIFSSVVICLLSGERTSFVLLFLNLIIIIFSCQSIRKIFLISLLITIPIILTLVFTDQKLKYRMYDFTMKQLGLNSSSERIVIFSETYEGHYKIAFNMFKEKPYTGHGVKSFRKYCDKKENFVAFNACTTHPHNVYMQLLSETGMISFLIIFLLFLFVAYKLFEISFKSIFLKKNNTEDYLTLIYIFYFVNLFPFSPSGNFFNNWLSMIYYLPSGYIIFLLYNKNART